MLTKKTRKGETNKSRHGLRMAVCEYRSATDIDVIFSDNSIVRHVRYADFKAGCITHLGRTKTDGMVGQTAVSADGAKMSVIEQYGQDNLTIRFDNGAIVCGVTAADFANGNVRSEGNNDTFSALLSEKEVRGFGIERERQLTFDNVCHLLEKYRRCVMIRPCGFGKTWIGIRLFKLPRYERCLFLHPQKDELNLAKVKETGVSVDTHTYAWLRRLNDKAIRALDYDLVFFDECHTLGGDDDGVGAAVTYAAVEKLMRWHPKTHFLGATATAIRMDGIDVVDKVFGNHVCYPYTDADAFEDGLLRVPYYFYNVYDVEKKIRERIAKAEKMYGVTIHLRRDQVEGILGDNAVSEANARYMDRHIREKCDTLLPSTHYMRFLAFYLTNRDINENRRKVERWFLKAYPQHQVVSTVVTNRTAVSLNAVDDLPTAPTRPGFAGRIDIVFSCEKLCMGYHSELVTGLILDRKTTSIAKYQQMLGRVLSFDTERPVIIFDIADNLHSDFVCKIRPVEPTSVRCSEDTPDEETFQGVLKKYPTSVHWERVYSNSHPHLNGKLPPVSHTNRNGWVDVIPYTTDAIPTIPFGFRTSDGGADNIESTTVPIPSAKVAHDRKSEPRQHSNLGMMRATDVSTTPLPVSEEIHSAKQTAAEEGYMPGMYYYVGGDLFSRNIQLRTENADAEEAIDGMLRKYAENTCRAVIEKWHTYPGCAENYANRDEIDPVSGKYKFLKACADIFGCPVNAVLNFMLDGLASPSAS